MRSVFKWWRNFFSKRLQESSFTSVIDSHIKSLASFNKLTHIDAFLILFQLFEDRLQHLHTLLIQTFKLNTLVRDLSIHVRIHYFKHPPKHFHFVTLKNLARVFVNLRRCQLSILISVLLLSLDRAHRLLIQTQWSVDAGTTLLRFVSVRTRRLIYLRNIIWIKVGFKWLLVLAILMHCSWSFGTILQLLGLQLRFKCTVWVLPFSINKVFAWSTQLWVFIQLFKFIHRLSLRSCCSTCLLLFHIWTLIEIS